MPLYDWRCRDCDHVTESLGQPWDDIRRCQCGGVAERQFPNRPPMTVAPYVDTRNWYRRYTEASAEIDHAVTRHERDTGQPAPDLGLWNAARQTANAMVAAGEAPAVRKDS